MITSSDGAAYPSGKGEVCKTSMQRFESARRLHATSPPMNEISRFADLWKGGYYEGDPLDQRGLSQYYGLGYVSVLWVVYQVCIRPYLTAETVALEIGPGRGAWTRTLLPAKEVWCLDALSAEHNGFWSYIGRAPNVRYIQVSDFECRDLPDSYFSYLFSFGTFCHITWESQEIYYRNLLNKLRPGANAFVMFADFDKYNSALRDWSGLQVFTIRPFNLVHHARWIFKNLRPWPKLIKDSHPFVPGKFQHVSVSTLADRLKKIGYEVICDDIGIVPRDPIVHFRKPG